MTVHQPLVIAIDGPAASGKGSLGARIANELGLQYLDTGRLYRAVGQAVIQNGWNVNAEFTNKEDAYASAYAKTLSVRNLDEIMKTNSLVGEEIGKAASIVSAKPGVRKALLELQRSVAGGRKGAVLDGRDIGTVVYPDADVKFFITASLKKRAERRFKQLQSQQKSVTYEQIFEELEARDERDSSREISPLVPAEDAIILDTTHLSLDEAFQTALRVIKRHQG